MLEYCENYLLCLKKKTKTKKLNPSIHSFLLPSRTEPGSYRVTRIQTLEYILKSVLGKKAARQLFQRSTEMMGFNFTASGYKARKSVRFLREFSSVNEKMFY